MGSSILLPVLALVFLVGAIHSSPYDEFRSSIVEFYDTNLDEPKYRLKDNVKPLRQTVDLDVYLDEDRFDGETSIYILTADNDMKQIVLHQNVVSISSVSVFNVTGAPVPLQAPGAFETDPYYEILMINLANPIPVGEYTLKIVYKGRINTNPLDRGFYKGYYFTDSSNTKMEYYATTQFQPYHARKAFPCFDEPQFKSYFTISITRPEDFSQSYSNMAIEKFETIVKEDGSTRVRETFYRTPIVSAYLLAFHVSKFVETQVNVDNKPFGVISRPGPVDQHAYAIRLGQLTTNWLSTKLKFDYYAMGEGVAMKNDHIALPDFPSGAMENWGMVNYREAYLLYDEQNTNLQNQIFIATIISHEMAHKWFGNLVTCFWWSNLWLNESFASFFEYFSTHGADPSLELDDQFVVDHVHSALAADASSGATPMNWTGVVTNPSISAHFSTTSYAKGASVLRMMEHFVGTDTFYKALEYYLRENQYQLGDPKKMYAAFETAVAEDGSLSQYTNVKITDVFDSWIQNPGAPVIHVNVDHSTGVITVKQERYQLSGIRPNTLWQIPLTYTRGDDVDFSNTKPSTVLVGESTTINKPAGHEWVIFNVAQSGYYRVNYDDHSWEMIAGGLRTSREAVHKLNRAQIVNDVLYFLRSGDVSIERAFDVLAFLKDETDYYVWAGAIGQLTWLRRRTEHIPALYNEFSAYLLEQMDAVINHLGYNENPSDSTSTILNRVQILNFACTLGHEGCVTDSLAKWKAFRETPTNLVHKNLRRHVYCVGVREGDRTDYDFLWQRYNSSQNTADMVVMLRALGCTKDEATLQHYLQQSLYSSSIRIHDKTNVVSYALLGNQENVKGVLNFIYNNYESIRTQYGGSARLETVLSTLAAYLTDFSDIVAIEAENLKQIVLHQKVVEISSVTVLSDGNKVQPLQTPNPFETDDYYEILKINLAQPIPAGNCTLVINYKGKINENALDRGFYRGHYFVNNTMLYYAVSHFQPYHARKAFPCFDEPQFKARFTISITRPSDFSRSYSNMNIRNTMTVSEGRVRETFDTTPEVSSYLVTFLVSRFVETQANSPTEPFGIISRPGPVDQHKYALDIGQKITNWMNQEFDINYYDMGQGEKMKNDHMALPDFPAGAMENWGMVNYRESNLLFDEKHTSLPGKLRTATIVAHELAHKWFGNLVTCFWWSNLWLNEAFAAFYQYFGAHGADGTLELDDQFVTTAVHSALANDANAGANPMNWTGAVDNPSVSAHFGVSSYAKAASVLRMMEHLVTPATFRKALRYYLKDNAYKLGTPEKMYTAFRRAVREDNTLSQLPGVDIGDVFDSWVQNPGAPVVKVDVDYATGAISVSQQRYQLSGVRPSTLWMIPLTYTRANNIDFENLRPSVILTGYNMTLPKPAGNEWVLFNTARSGLYRVNYDDFSWELIAEGLRTSREAIHKLSRAQIVNDVLFFIRSGDISIARAFDVLSFLKDETDYYVWNAAMGQLDWLRRRTKHIDNLYQEFNGYLLEQMNSVIETLGYDEGENDSVSTILNRIQILSYACNMGHEGCVTDAVTKWNAFRQNTDNLVPPNLRAHVYCVGLREGNRADYDFLWQRYNTSENAVDMVLMLGALPCTRDQTAVHHYLEQSLYSGTIRLHDKPTAFSNALAGNPENLQTVLNFVFTRYEDIRVHYGGTARLVMGLNSIAAYLTDFSDIIKFQTWAYENQLSLTPEEFASSRSVVNSAVNNLNWASRNAVDLHTALVTRNASSSLFAPVTMVLAAVILHLFY